MCSETLTKKGSRIHFGDSAGCTANTRRFFSGYPGCDTASTTAAGVTIHQKKEHLDWLDAAVIAETEASQKGQRANGLRKGRKT